MVFIKVGNLEGLIFGYASWTVDWPDGSKGCVSVGCREGFEGDAFDDNEHKMAPAFEKEGVDGSSWTIGRYAGRSNKAPRTLEDLASVTGLSSKVEQSGRRGEGGDEVGNPFKPRQM